MLYLVFASPCGYFALRAGLLSSVPPPVAIAYTYPYGPPATRTLDDYMYHAQPLIMQLPIAMAPVRTVGSLTAHTPASRGVSVLPVQCHWHTYS